MGKSDPVSFSRGKRGSKMPILKKLNMQKPEYRLISRSGQDRTANQRCGRETNKGNRKVGYIVPSITITNEMIVKNMIAGSLVFTNFDRSALYDVTNKRYGISSQYFKKTFDLPAAGRSVELENTDIGSLVTRTTANYPDQVPPFNITITAANEFRSIWE